MGVALHQPGEQGALLRPVRPVGQDHRVLGDHGALNVVSLAVVDAEKGLLHRNGPLQHGLHHRRVGAVFDPADIEYLLAPGDEGIYPCRVVPDHAAAGRFGPAAEAAHAVCDAEGGEIHGGGILGESGGHGTVRHQQFHGCSFPGENSPSEMI